MTLSAEEKAYLNQNCPEEHKELLFSFLDSMRDEEELNAVLETVKLLSDHFNDVIVPLGEILKNA